MKSSIVRGCSHFGQRDRVASTEPWLACAMGEETAEPLPGAFVYHCAVANVAYHISSGMFGMILVEPEEGLPDVDRVLLGSAGTLHERDRRR